VINKVGQAPEEVVRQMQQQIQAVNPAATQILADLEVSVDQPESIWGKKVLVVEDGPTVTHGDMTYGAGTIAARQFGAAELVDPRRSAVGTIARALEQYPRLTHVLPALGYSPQQCDDLTRTIENSEAEVVVDASPAQLGRLLRLTLPVVRVRYQFRQVSGPPLADWVDARLADLAHPTASPDTRPDSPG
jgi:predicted GTPase